MGEKDEILNSGHGMAAIYINSLHLWFLVQDLYKLKPVTIHHGRGRGS